MEDFKKICRACLKKDENMRHIFLYSIDQMFEEMMSLIVFKNDGLPEQICESCFNRINDAFSFKTLCLASNNTLRNILENSKANNVKEEVQEETVTQPNTSNLESTLVIDSQSEPDNEMNDEDVEVINQKKRKKDTLENDNQMLKTRKEYVESTCEEDVANNVKEEILTIEASKKHKSSSSPEHQEKNESTDYPLLPKKSNARYKRQYSSFLNWCNEHKIQDISENVLVTYFKLQSKTFKSSSLWTMYSMLRSCLKADKNVDIAKYQTLQDFLKQSGKDYTPKKTEILKVSDINEFIKEASDREYLLAKVILIIGYTGACSRNELMHICVDDIDFKSDCVTVKVRETKNNVPRVFSITDLNWIQFLEKYLALRPKLIDNNRFFISYRNGSCTKTPVGVNTMGNIPKVIANYLKLPNPHYYTGNCFRRSKALGMKSLREAEFLKVRFENRNSTSNTDVSGFEEKVEIQDSDDSSNEESIKVEVNDEEMPLMDPYSSGPSHHQIDVTIKKEPET